MNSQETYGFDQLKKTVFDIFSKTHSTPSSFEKFGKEDIIAFQEDLFDKVKTKVSEKWFYSYFKNSPEKLPRIDMLNLLSQYAGYQNWNEFNTTRKKSRSKRKNMIWFIPFLLIILLGFIFTPGENTFHFCFVDEDRNEAISSVVNVEVLLENQSPLYLQTNPKGCLIYKSSEDQITFVVKSNYYKTDTIVRSVKNQQGTIHLKVDDYALMLDYYSKGKVKDLNLRKIQLENLIDNNAIIYQMYSNKNEVEIYSKSEFINMLMIPTNSLKNIQYLKKEFIGEKIVKLKFIVK